MVTSEPSEPRTLHPWETPDDDLPPLQVPVPGDEEPESEHYTIGIEEIESDDFPTPAEDSLVMEGLRALAPDWVIPRSVWGARAPRNRTGLTTSQGNTVHYEGPKMGPYEHGTCHAKVRGIQNFHMDARAWADIAYSTITCRHGYVFEGRGYGVRTAANGTNDGNARSHAHCIMIGVGDDFPEDARDAVRKIVTDYEGRGSGTRRWVHSDWLATACCGDPARNWTRAGMPDEIPDGYIPAPDQPPPPPGVAPLHQTIRANENISQGKSGHYARIAQALEIVHCGLPEGKSIDGYFGPTSARYLADWLMKVPIPDQPIEVGPEGISEAE